MATGCILLLPAAAPANSIEQQKRQILFEAMLYDGGSSPSIRDKSPEVPSTQKKPAHTAKKTPQRKQETTAQPIATETHATTHVDYSAAIPSEEVRYVQAAPVQRAGGYQPVQMNAPAIQYGEVYQRANAGDPDAEYQMGMFYTQDRAGTANSNQQSYHWFTQAASKGHPRAQYNLGVMYAQGDGIVQNLIEAYIWFNLAAAQQMNGAAQARDMIAGSLTPDALMKAQERSTFYYQKISQNISRMKKQGPSAVIPIR